jgi:transcriptional regulator with XRE-family HTH domain
MPEKPAMRNDLALALRLLRHLRGLEQEELAAASGVSCSSVAKIEQGVRQLTAASFGAIVAALGVDLATVEAQVAVIRKVRGGPSTAEPPGWVGKAAAGTATLPEREPKEVGGALGARLAGGSAQGAALSLAESRRRAPGLWARLARYPHVARRALIQEVAEFQDSGFCELLCEASVAAAGDDAQEALRLAELAVLAGERVPGEEAWRGRVEGYARAHLTNALRVQGRLQEAGETLMRAAALWQAGAASDPGHLNEARVLGLEASLRRDRRELPQALALLDRALAIDRWGETPSLLLAKSKALEELGDFAESIALLRQAAAQIDGEREPRKLFAAHHNLAFNLCHLGRHAEAELGLPEVRELAQRLGNQLDGLRVAWLEAKVAAGLGRTAAAAAGFERVRAGFADRQIAYDAALVTLELAELQASLGRTAEVKALARASAPIFEDQGVHHEARRALELFGLAAEQERVSVELIRRVLAYLQQARHDPQLRYQKMG